MVVGDGGTLGRVNDGGGFIGMVFTPRRRRKRPRSSGGGSIDATRGTAPRAPHWCGGPARAVRRCTTRCRGGASPRVRLCAPIAREPSYCITCSSSEAFSSSSEASSSSTSGYSTFTTYRSPSDPLLLVRGPLVDEVGLSLALGNQKLYTSAVVAHN
jgi:hypothetical protein